MAPIVRKPQSRPVGYPSPALVARGCAVYAQIKPPIIYRTCPAKLHGLHRNKEAALLQVFANATLAASWMLRDIAERKPRERFRKFRTPRGFRYDTDRIADHINKHYRDKIRKRYAINTFVYAAVCSAIARMISLWLRNMAEAERKGYLKRYAESAAYVIPFGKHQGKSLGSLGRKTIFGYAFLMPKPAQRHEALRFIDILLNQYPEEEPLFEQAEAYKMPFGPRQGDALGDMLHETLRRLRALILRDEQRSDEIEHLRAIAQTYLRFTPPGFPCVGTDGISATRRAHLEHESEETLAAFGSLPASDASAILWMTENEMALFADLQQRAYAATKEQRYISFRWQRADGCIKGRDVGLVYAPKTHRYKLLAYVLAPSSRHRRLLRVNENLYDVNNPGVQLTSSTRSTIALLFDLEFGREQHALLDRARRAVSEWKNGKDTSSGPIRSASLHAHYDEQRKAWWFETNISVGTRASRILAPQHVVGVHFDPKFGVFVSVISLTGAVVDQFHLDAAKLVELLDQPSRRLMERAHPRSNQERTMLEQQATQFQHIDRHRTQKERTHRLADAISAVCEQYQAQLGVENISYRRQPGDGPEIVFQGGSEISRGVVELLPYKLLLAQLPEPIDIRGISPRRDCGACGQRKAAGESGNMFCCPKCQTEGNRYFNTAREVARRALWVVARKTVKKPKKSKTRGSLEPSRAV